MGPSFSDSSGVFSECNSDRSGEFSGSSTAALHRLLLSSPPNNSGELISSLISDLSSPSIDQQRRSAMELRLLAKHSTDNRINIARAGAIPPLISLISHSDPLLQENGVTAILNLSLCDENKDLIAASGAIKPLIHALKAGSFAARENAACALFRLSQMEEHRVTIGRHGAIPPLVDLLRTGTARGKKDALTALYYLCSTGDNKIRAVKAGVVRSLLDLMADSEYGMVDKAAYVLNAVVGVPEGVAAAVKEEGIAVLVEVVEIGTLSQKKMAATILMTVCEAAVQHRAMAVREGAVPPLVSMAQSGSARARQKAEALIDLLRQPRAAESG